MKDYTVYLFRSPNCTRGWIAYVDPAHGREATFTVKLQAESGQKAKNKAITLINKGFDGLKVVGMEFDGLWGINKFPELKKMIYDLAEREFVEYWRKLYPASMPKDKLPDYDKEKKYFIATFFNRTKALS